MAKRLTEISIAKVKPHPTKRLEIPDAGKPGLYLVVQPSGHKGWAVRYRRRSDGKTRKLALDGFVSLATAHKLAQEALDKVAEGGDPAAEKRSAKAAPMARADTFAEIAEQFIKRHVIPNASARYRYEVERMLRKDVLPAWGHRLIGTLAKRDVVELLDGIVDRGGGLTSNQVLATVRKLFNWSVARGIVETSPVQGVKAPLAETARDRVLTDAEILDFWNATSEVPYPFGPFARLLLLTGQRRTEVAGMTWGEVNLDLATWTIPATRTKNSERHEVHLAHAVLDIIKAVPRISSDKGYVFTTNGKTHVTGYSRAKSCIDKRMSPMPTWTFHDLRRTAASGMAKLGINLPVIEKVLNHTSGSFAGIVGVYQRHSFAEEKRNALEAWGRYVLSLQNPADNVTRMPQRAG
jgi:integrase